MEAERARLRSSLQLPHGFLQRHHFLRRPGWMEALCGRLVGESQGRRQLQQGRRTAGTCNPGPAGTSSDSAVTRTQPGRHLGGTETNTHTPLRLMSKASSLEWDSRLARMNMTTWSCVCSEMSLPLISTTRSPSMSVGSHRPACKDARFLDEMSASRVPPDLLF